jgi:hypothetical protein
MSNPWDVPPLPIVGDADIMTTYAGVGIVLSAWEEIELSLSQFYSFMVGRPYHIDAMREYGRGTIFRERMKILVDETHIRLCCQTQEGEFDKIAEECIGFSNRRNDVAHGIVRPIEMLYPPPPDAADAECLPMRTQGQ